VAGRALAGHGDRRLGGHHERHGWPALKRDAIHSEPYVRALSAIAAMRVTRTGNELIRRSWRISLDWLGDS
jgi:hypothetical protein